MSGPAQPPLMVDEAMLQGLVDRIGALERARAQDRDRIVRLEAALATLRRAGSPIASGGTDSVSSAAVAATSATAAPAPRADTPPLRRITLFSRSGEKVTCKCDGDFKKKGRTQHIKSPHHVRYVARNRLFCDGTSCVGERVTGGVFPSAVEVREGASPSKLSGVRVQDGRRLESDGHVLCALCGAKLVIDERKRRRTDEQGDQAVALRLPDAMRDREPGPGPGVVFVVRRASDGVHEVVDDVPRSERFWMAVIPNILRVTPPLVHYDAAQHTLGVSHVPVTKCGHVDVFVLVDPAADLGDSVLEQVQTGALRLFAGRNDGWLVAASDSKSALDSTLIEVAVECRSMRVDQAIAFSATDPRLPKMSGSCEPFDPDPERRCSVAVERGATRMLRRWPRQPHVDDDVEMLHLLVYVSEWQEVTDNPRGEMDNALDSGDNVCRAVDRFGLSWCVRQLDRTHAAVGVADKLLELACGERGRSDLLPLVLRHVSPDSAALIAATREACVRHDTKLRDFVDPILQKANDKSAVARVACLASIQGDLGVELQHFLVFNPVPFLVSWGKDEMLQKAVLADALACLDVLGPTATDVSSAVVALAVRHARPEFVQCLLELTDLANDFVRLSDAAEHVGRHLSSMIRFVLDIRTFSPVELGDQLVSMLSRSLWANRCGADLESAVRALVQAGAQIPQLSKKLEVELCTAIDWKSGGTLVELLDPCITQWTLPGIATLACSTRNTNLVTSVAGKMAGGGDRQKLILLAAVHSKAVPQLVRDSTATEPQALWFAMSTPKNGCATESERLATADALLDNDCWMDSNAQDMAKLLTKCFERPDVDVCEHVLDRFVGDARVRSLFDNDISMPARLRAAQLSEHILFPLFHRDTSPSADSIRAVVLDGNHHVSFHPTVGRWALQQAVKSGWARSVDLLLRHHDVDPNSLLQHETIWDAFQTCSAVHRAQSDAVLEALVSCERLEVRGHECGAFAAVARCSPASLFRLFDHPSFARRAGAPWTRAESIAVLRSVLQCDDHVLLDRLLWQVTPFDPSVVLTDFALKDCRGDEARRLIGRKRERLGGGGDGGR